MRPAGNRNELLIPPGTPGSAVARAWRWPLAALLGMAAAWLNGAWQPPLLHEATPLFSFGWIFSYFAYLLLGEGPGLLAATLGAAGGTIRIFLLYHDPGIAFSGIIYVLESWMAWRLSRLTGSLVLAALLFWVSAGWIVDVAWYHALNGLPLTYVGLMLIKQVFNSMACTVAAQLAFVALPHRWSGAREAPEPLRRFVLSRLILVVAPLATVTGLIYTRTALRQAENQALLHQQGTAGRLAVTFRSYLQEREAELGALTERIQQLRALRDTASASRAVRDFVRGHPEFMNVGLFDSTGRVTTMSPDTTPDGKPLRLIDLHQRPYFTQLRAGARTIWAPLILGTLGLRRTNAPEPIMVIAHRISNAGGQFSGGLTAALDIEYLRPILHSVAADSSQEITLLDSERAVIVSLGDRMPPGASLRAMIPDSIFERGAGGVFNYYPAPDSSRLSILGLNLRHAAYQSVAEPGWGVMVDISSVALHYAMVPAVARVLLLIVVIPLILFAAVRIGSDRVSRPLMLVSRTAGDIAEGRTEGAEPLAPLTASPIVEIRELARRFVGMGQALAARYAREQLRAAESEQRFQIAFENPFVGVRHVDAEGHTIRVNDRFCEMVGYSREELLEKSILPLVPEERRAEATTLLRGALAGGESTGVIEFPIRRKDGSQIMVRWTAAPVRDPAGKFAYAVLTGEDVTARRSLEQQLLQAQKIEAIGLLAGGVAHDFNNLLTPILGYTEMALDQVPEGSPIREDLQQVQSAAGRARDLTQQLLAFGRKQILEMRPLRLGEVIEQFRRLLRPIMRENITIATDVDAELGTVRADPTQIQQVLMNLSVNAIDAMPQGGTLTIAARNVTISDPQSVASLGVPPGAYVALVVGDTGHGISAAVRRHIFEPFFTTKELGKGTGLGLATVHGIVRQHDGAITVDSQDGAGTAFTIYLPRRADEPAESATAPGPGGDGPRVAGLETILVVEDDSAVRRLLTSILERQGYRVLEADSGEAALKRLDGYAGPLPLLCTDVIMPGMSGRELFVRLRGRYPRLRALFVSGYAGDPSGPETLPLEPGTAFIQKPFAADELLARIEEVFAVSL